MLNRKFFVFFSKIILKYQEHFAYMNLEFLETKSAAFASMGSTSSKYEHSHSLRSKLRNRLFTRPTDQDYEVLCQLINLPKSELVPIVETHLTIHPDGRMNRKEYCDLYHSLRGESADIVRGLSDNIFRALGVSSDQNESDLITLQEFFVTYVLTSPGDLRRKLEYCFDQYDMNHDDALDLDEVKELVYGLLEFFEKPKDLSVIDVCRECVKDMKVTQVVKKRK